MTRIPRGLSGPGIRHTGSSHGRSLETGPASSEGLWNSSCSLGLSLSVAHSAGGEVEGCSGSGGEESVRVVGIGGVELWVGAVFVRSGVAFHEPHEAGDEVHHSDEHDGQSQKPGYSVIAGYQAEFFTKSCQRECEIRGICPKYPHTATADVVKPPHTCGDGWNQPRQIEDQSRNNEEQGQQTHDKEANDIEGPEFHTARAAPEFRIPAPAKAEALRRCQRRRAYGAYRIHWVFPSASHSADGEVGLLVEAMKTGKISRSVSPQIPLFYPRQ